MAFNPLRIVRAADRRAMPWKNRGGTTFEVAAVPAGAGLDRIDWRISMALVETDGPFSIFPGIDRTLAVLAGDGISLSIAGSPPVALSRTSAPHSFAADAPTEGRLTGGAITDLNVMTRRGRFTHRLTRLRLESPSDIPLRAGVTVLVATTPGLRIESERGAVELGAEDSAIFDGAGDVVRLSAAAPCDLFMIELDPASRSGC